MIADFLKVERSAYETINEYMDLETLERPPNYFRLGKVKKVNKETKEIFIDVSTNMPIANCGDGVAVNNKAARILYELYGLESPGKLEIYKSQ